MRQLFPAIKPYVTHSITVDSPHVLHVEECGEPDGIPVLYVHGGPGAGCAPFHRCFFNPEKYRIILFDQRGSGQSTPHAGLENNTTQALVQDMEQIREHLGVKKWLLFGGSWGSTLSLVYAQTCPQNVLGMILRGIFLCTPEEIHWFYQQGANRLFADYWQEFLKPIPLAEQGNLLSAYYKRLTGSDEIARMAAAKAWSTWEGRCLSLLPAPGVVAQLSDPHRALSLARIESHYFMNDGFLQPDQIINNAAAIAHIPGTIVQGRYDVICPLESAWRLQQVWPQAQLQIIPDAGHAATEPGIIDALVKATESYTDLS